MKMQTVESVWDALKDTPEQTANMKLRSDLMMEVERYVRTLDVTQVEAAKQLGLTQPRLNDLLKGKIDKFSLDALVNILARAGRQVSVKVEQAA